MDCGAAIASWGNTLGLTVVCAGSMGVPSPATTSLPRRNSLPSSLFANVIRRLAAWPGGSTMQFSGAAAAVADIRAIARGDAPPLRGRTISGRRSAAGANAARIRGVAAMAAGASMRMRSMRGHGSPADPVVIPAVRNVMVPAPGLGAGRKISARRPA